MAIRTGAQYIAAIDRMKVDIWVEGKRVEGKISEHPAFRNVIRTQAKLYDMQHDPDKPYMTYRSPKSGERVSASFLAPKTKEDLEQRRRLTYEWAKYTCGMMGRTPDYLNAALMAFASAADYFGQKERRFADNVRAYYEYCRENDLCLTHTLIHPQVNRSKSAAQQADPYIAARIVKKTADGIVIRGARLLATQAGITDEILVFPSTLLKSSEEDRPYVFAFAIPNDTPGLKFLCRESLDYGKSSFDHPLGSRFEEMDAVVVFEDVLVPWERVFALEDIEVCNHAYRETNAVVHMTHQVVTKNVAKTEFLLGVLTHMAETIAVDRYSHVRERIAEVIIALETLKAFLVASEAEAKVDRWGNLTPNFAPLNAARNWYPRLYGRLMETFHQLGASGLIAIPTEADFRNPQVRPHLDKYLQSANADAYERVQLFRLAWDICMSGFGMRQVLYERFFFGDPVRMAEALYLGYDKQVYVDRVKEFLARLREDEEVRA